MDGGGYSHLPPPPSAPPPPAASGWDGSPWGPPRPPFLPDGLPSKLRRVLGAIATVGFVGVASVWLASFLPSAPAASWWGVVVVPVFLAVFPLHAATILDLSRRQGPRPASRSRSVPLRGWRAVVLGVVAAAAFASFFATFLGVGVSTVIDDEDAATSEVHGSRPVHSVEELDRSAAAESRLMSSVVMVFTAMAALYLTMPEEELEAAFAPTETVLPPPVRSRPGPADAIRRLVGRATLAIDVAGSPDDVLARLAWSAPVREVARTGVTGITVQAVWKEAPKRMTRAMELRLDGTIAPLGPRGSRVEVTVAPAARGLVPTAVASSVWALVVIGVGAMVLTAAAPLLAVPWLAFGVYAAYANLTIARRPTAVAIARVEAAARGRG